MLHDPPTLLQDCVPKPVPQAGVAQFPHVRHVPRLSLQRDCSRHPYHGSNFLYHRLIQLGWLEHFRGLSDPIRCHLNDLATSAAQKAGEVQLLTHHFDQLNSRNARLS